MSATTTAARPGTTPSTPRPDIGARLRRAPRWAWVLAILVTWYLAYLIWGGQDTLFLVQRASTDLHDNITEWKADLIASRDSNPLMQAVGWVSDGLDSFGGWLQELVSQPAIPRPVPQVGWLGVVAVAGWVGLAVAGWRIALMVVASFLSFGFLGYWEDSLDTLIVTFLAVAISLAVGLPLAIWMSRSKVVRSVVTPVLDVLQTMPSFNYLVPVFLFFGLGLPCAVVVTLLYATAPVVRIAAHGIMSVPKTTLEATDSLGNTKWQRLMKVELPMAKSTIIVGINQTIMAALAMVIIAGYVNGPGLGQPVLQALAALQVGNSFVAGLCIVVMAIMLDRTTAAASTHAERRARANASAQQRRILLAGTGLVAVFCIWLSRYQTRFAEFPETSIGSTIAEQVQRFADWFTDTFGTATDWFKDLVSNELLNPLQSLLAESPWFVTGLALVALAYVLAGLRGGVWALVCLAGIYYTDLWYDTMVTLAMTLVGTVLTLLIGVVLGIWMGRRRQVDLLLRPVLDAAQVMPPFVYLIPALLLFGSTRFTAIAAAVIYAVPVAAKLVADGIQRVSPTTVEAAESAGTTSWQMIRKVQLPMAKGSLLLATNQGLLYVLSMTVIGGLVGAGALGYDSALGIGQSDSFGKGLAAAGCIVLLGIMLDRVARLAAERSGESADAALVPRKPA